LLNLIKKIVFVILFFSIINHSDANQKNKIIISTANPIASKVGNEILLNGGSAVDAAIAVQLILNLVEPQSSGIGGGGFLLYYDNKTKKLVFYDGRETAPLKIKKKHFLDKNEVPLSFYDAAVGGLAVGVPGLVSMLELAHKEHGVMKWKNLFEPAIKLSTRGFPISSRLHNQIKKDNYLHLIPNTSKYFYEKNNNPKKTGVILKNNKFAETLKIISIKGSKGFYKGKISKEIISTIHNSPVREGVMNLKDLGNYKAVKQKPICGKYRKYKICSASLPSAGGFSLIQILKILENFELSKNTIKEDIHLILEASKYSYLDRFKYLGDPSFNKINLKKLLSEDYTRNIASKISPKNITQLNFSQNKELNNLRSTTHFSIRDQYGNLVSMTSSIENSFGSRLMSGGFLLNNQLSDFNFKESNDLYKNNIVEPGKKPLSSMSPTIVFDRENNIKMVIGSPGGKSIIMYVLKTIIAVLDWDMLIKNAVKFPNFSLRKNTVLLEEKIFDKKIQKYLFDLGHEIENRELNSGLNGFEIKNNKIYGIADDRRKGLVFIN